MCNALASGTQGTKAKTSMWQRRSWWSCWCPFLTRCCRHRCLKTLQCQPQDVICSFVPESWRWCLSTWHHHHSWGRANWHHRAHFFCWLLVAMSNCLHQNAHLWDWSLWQHSNLHILLWALQAPDWSAFIWANLPPKETLGLFIFPPFFSLHASSPWFWLPSPLAFATQLLMFFH